MDEKRKYQQWAFSLSSADYERILGILWCDWYVRPRLLQPLRWRRRQQQIHILSLSHSIPFQSNGVKLSNNSAKKRREKIIKLRFDCIQFFRTWRLALIDEMRSLCLMLYFSSAVLKSAGPDWWRLGLSRETRCRSGCTMCSYVLAAI